MPDSMTPKERILAAYARQDVDRLPVSPNLTRWVRGNRGSTSELQQLAVAEEFGFDPLIMYGMYLNHPIASDYVYRPDCDGGYRDLPDVNIDMRVENLADRTIHVRQFETPDGILTDKIVWARPGREYGDGPNPHHDEPLVKSIADVPALRYLYARPQNGFTEDLKIFTEMVGPRGLVEYCECTNAGGWGMESLGPENMLMAAVQDKELLRAVLEVSQEAHLANLKCVLESGHKHVIVSWFQCGPSVGWSPANIQEFFLPLIRQSVELTHDYRATYRYQDDGRMADIIPQLVEMNVEVVGALQPPPVGDCVLGDLKQKFGERVCLYGGLDPVYTFELGDARRVRQAVADLLRHVDDLRGIVLGVGEAFGPETPAECIHELATAALELSAKML